jgi:hypothetical protein
MLLFVTTEAAYPAATVAEMLKSQKKKVGIRERLLYKASIKTTFKKIHT